MPTCAMQEYVLPTVLDRHSPLVENPYFAGYTNPLSGHLRELGIHASQIAGQIGKSSLSAQRHAWQNAGLSGSATDDVN
jgi:hypothetical protein